MDAAVVGGLIELAKMGLNIYLLASRQAGLTAEEKIKLHDEVEKAFLAELNEPLPEVPK